MANKDTQDRINALVTEEKLQNNIADALTSQLDLRTREGRIVKQLAEDLISQKGIENKLEAILETKQKLLEGQLDLSEDKAKLLLKELETAEELLKLEGKRKDKQAEIKDLTEDFKNSLLGSVGLSADMLKNGIGFGIGMAIAKKGVDLLSSAFESTVGLAKELYTQTGATAGEAARVGVEVTKASLSMTGLLYGSEAVADAAKSTAEYFGSTRVISSDMLKNVTELNAMMGDGAGAAQMSQLLQSASGNAAGLTSEIKEIAQGVGVDASEVFKEMGKNANLLVGKSKEEIKILAKKTAELKKQGMSMDLMNSVSENMLDIESSLRAEMKARIFGMDVNAAAMREAALAFQMTGDATALSKALQEQIGTAEEFGEMGPMQQRIYADALGMTSEQITEMLTKQEALSHQTEMYGEFGVKAMGKVTAAASSLGSGFAASIPLLASTSVFMKNIGIDVGGMAKSMGGMVKSSAEFLKNLVKAGASKAMGMFGKSGTAGAATAAAANVTPPSPVDNVVGGAKKNATKGGGGIGKTISGLGKGVGGALKGIAGGFAAFANPATILGVAVITAGLIGVGFALKVAAPGIKAIGEAISTVVGALGDFIVKIAQIASPEVGLGLMSLALGFASLSIALASFAIAGIAATPAMVAVGVFTAAMTALGTVSDSFDKSNDDSTEGSSSDALLQEIKGLRFDIQNQPVQIVIDDKVISTMNKKNSRMQGYRDQMR
jgi:hypothetical protein